jgi:hypothetical protein
MRQRATFNLALVAILGVFLTACLFARPIADDFIYASNARAGFWSAWLREYLGWNGRYASNAFVLGVPAAPASAGYRVAAAAMLVSTAVALYAFVRTLAADSVTRSDVLSCSLVFLALFVVQVPSIGESIYWFTSAATYQLPLALVRRYVSHEHPGISERLGLALASVLLVIVVGSNEVIMLMMLGFYAAWMMLGLRERARRSGESPRRRSRRLPPAGLFAVAALCALAVALSPGNGVRQSMFPQVHHQMGRSLVMTMLQTLRFSSDWISASALLLATALFMPIAEKLSRQWSPNPYRAKEWLVVLVIGLLFVVPVAAFPAYWETGVLGQHRTVDMAYFVFLIMWFLLVVMWFAVNPGQAPRLATALEPFRISIAAVLIVLLALTRNSYVVGTDLISGRLSGFGREIDSRHAALEACAQQGLRTCEVPAIQNKPASFYVVDISSDPHDWVNASYARYFGLSEVHLRATGP